MNALLGKKIGMTQVFSQEGDCVPVTVIQVEKCIPVLRREKNKDGYSAVLLAYGERKAKHTRKPLQGFCDKHKISSPRLLVEFRDQEVDDDQLGKPLNVEVFAAGDKVSVVGISKGKGFAGVMKRHGFAGAPASRGSHEAFRGGGSIGMHTYPGRVFRGKEMPGRMGGDKIHIKNLQVVRVDKERNVILVKGAIPGAAGGIVRIVKSGSAKK